MRALVTGAAGFIGSHLTERLLADGHTVIGLDAFTDYYDPATKRANLADAIDAPGFRLVEGDLTDVDLPALLEGVDTVFHQAGQPGVRLSWADGFAQYVHRNVTTTQVLLEGCHRAGVGRVVYASSSSVYGNASRYPTRERDLPRPHSPYGVTKLAAEHLCGLYAENWGLSTVSLRYFTVYGPRQRPDMALHRLVSAALTGTSFPLYGDGTNIRDFTFVGDIVAANMAAATADVAPGTVCNVAGGGSTSVSELIALVEQTVGAPIALDRHPAAPGDVDRTGGTIDLARELLGWEPGVALPEGVAAQVAAARA